MVSKTLIPIILGSMAVETLTLLKLGWFKDPKVLLISNNLSNYPLF